MDLTRRHLTWLCVAYVTFSLHTAWAWRTADLWWRPDQQALHAMRHNKPQQASQLFTTPSWKAVAHYRAGQYHAAVEALAPLHTPLANYNRGNALARLGDYEQAIAAYDEALRLDPRDPDAKHNREVLKQLLKQQKHRSMKQKNRPSRHSKQQHNPHPNKSSKKNPSPDAKHAPKDPKKSSTQNSHAKVKRHEIDKATQHWLNQIPDNPGGLLRQKFLRDYQRSRRQRS